jgi:hypothetical protein
VVEALRRFFVAVSSPDALPEFAGIQSPRLRGDAVSRCVVWSVLQQVAGGAEKLDNEQVRAARSVCSVPLML